MRWQVRSTHAVEAEAQQRRYAFAENKVTARVYKAKALVQP